MNIYKWHVIQEMCVVLGLGWKVPFIKLKIQSILYSLFVSDDSVPNFELLWRSMFCDHRLFSQICYSWAEMKFYYL